MVKIVIPLHKETLKYFESLGLKQTTEVLNRYHFTLVCPRGLDIDRIKTIFSGVNYEVNYFPPHFFYNTDGYNKLMLSEKFYAEFLDVEYILICQTDVFVFKDDLGKWCDKNLDYTGAPWIASKRNAWNKTMLRIRNVFNKTKKSDHHFFKVGNGGFSLRRVKTMYEITRQLKEEIDYFQSFRDRYQFSQEDVFLSLKAPEYFPEMRIPDYQEAVSFCIDRKPKIAMELNDNKLPMACHGFNKPKVSEFWKPIIESQLKHSVDI